jgi:hypothetical protein
MLQSTRLSTAIALQYCRRSPSATYRLFSSKPSKDKGGLNLMQAGMPMLLFCGLGVWVVSNGIDGKNKERDTFQGRISKYVHEAFSLTGACAKFVSPKHNLFSCTRSERQSIMEKEHGDMMEKLNHIVALDFDNTKRIERPEEILARRRKEREARNVWYRRWGRRVLGQE